MEKRTKLWTNMSAIAFASVTALSACSAGGEGGEGEGEGHATEQNSTKASQVASSDGEGEGEGEGEGGEGEGSAAPAGEGEGEGEGEGASADIPLATDDIAYLTQLGLMRGHLFVGNELYKAGHIDHAKMHMKHPKSELYATVEPAFGARNATGFATQLEMLANAVEGEQGDDAVAKGYAAVTTAIATTEAAVAENSLTAAAKLKLVVELLRVAAEEYAIAVVDGKMENAHEYQDAFGFTNIAKSVIASAPKGNPETAAVLVKAAAIVEGLTPLWPGLIPPATLETEAGQLYGAASQIELLALGLE